MATNPTNVESDISHSHGDAGTEPPDGRWFINNESNTSDTSAEESVQAPTYNWLFSTWISKFNGLAQGQRNILDGTWTVSKADRAADADASTYKGNDIDTDGNGKVDVAENADNATALQGNSPSDLHVDVEDNGTVVLSGVPNINFGSNLSVTDDGDGTVSVTGTAETYPSVSENGTQVEASSTDINFGSNLTAASDGDGTTTVTADDDATTYKGNDIDNDGDGKVNSANVADTVHGNDGATHYAGSIPRYADSTTGLNNTTEGDLFYNNADNSLYLNDGT